MFSFWKKTPKKVIRFTPSLFTPDMPLLEQYQSRLLFVADEWMRDRRQNFVLDDLDVVRHGAAFTFGRFNYRTFEGMNYDRQHVNVALKVYHPDDGFRIMGEVVELRNPHQAFLKLDKLRLNTVQLLRQRVILAMPYRDGPIVFENTTEERKPIKYGNTGIDWLTGKFP